MRPQLLVAALALSSTFILCQCAGEPDVIDYGLIGDDESIVVPPGKEDDFLALTAQEYLVEGTATITLSEHEGTLLESTRLHRVKRLIPYKQIAITWFLHSFIAPKDAKDPNAKYGGFHALTKNADFDELEIQAIDDRTYQFQFRQELGGPIDLLSRLPVMTAPDGTMRFDLTMGQVSNEQIQQLEINAEWYREEPWKHFAPHRLGADQLEQIALTITPQPRSSDGWIDYNKLFADGRVNIGVHFGWDYHRQDHLKDSRRTYQWLVQQGFSSPVSSFEQLDRLSGPLRKTIQANGQAVTIEVSLFWGQPGTKTDPDTDQGGRWLEKDMIRSLENRDVIIFSGHSGPFYGFALANWKKTDEGDLDDSEIEALNLPQSYQVILAEGCQTYALGEAFGRNPSKLDRSALDIVTTTTYSTAEDADPVKDFLTAIIGTDTNGNHWPATYGELLRDLDYNAWDPAMYGVHGIDDNPHLHPYANPDRFCQTCSFDTDCGPLSGGNICVRLGTDGRICSAECTATDGCPTGYTCAAVARGQTLTGRVCVPSNYSCSGALPAGISVILNEVLADVPNGPTGDLNEDGFYDAVEDEFVEIVNATERSVSLGGWTLADGTKVRFTFPAGIELAPNEATVIFGGGNIGPLALAPDVRVFAAPEGLQLGNQGDSIILRDHEGQVVDRLVFGSEGDQDQSLNREEDGNPEADFTVHPGHVPGSPGTRVSGAPF